MATKLKSLSKNKTVRLIAFILAVILFASSGYFSSMFIKSEFAYNSFDGRAFIQTGAFRSVFDLVQRDAIYHGDSMLIESIEEFEKTYYGQEIKNRYLRERYGKSKQMMWVGETPLVPLAYQSNLQLR